MKRPDKGSANNHGRNTREPLQLGDWVLHPDLALLRQADQEVRLNPKALETLLVLIDAGERGVSREALLRQVWNENYPSDYVVSRAVADLRAAFGENAGQQKYIRTLPKYGYQLVAQTGRVRNNENKTVMHPKWVGVILLTILFLGVLLWFAKQEQQPAPASTLLKPRPLTSAPGLEHQPRLSADSKWVVYAVLKPGRPDWDIFRVSLESGEIQPVAVSDAVEHGPVFSPRADELAYVRLSTDICDVVTQPVSLGVPKAVASCTAKFASLVDWSVDGEWLAYTTAESDDPDQLRRIYRVNLSGGPPQQVSNNVSPTGSDFFPRFSPNGHKLAFLRGEPQPDHRSTLWVVDLQDGSEKALSKQAATLGGMSWLSDTELIYTVAEAGKMVARRVNINGQSDAVLALGDNLIHLDYEPDLHTLVAVQMRRDHNLRILYADSSSREIAASTADELAARFSADEQWVTMVSRRSGFDEVWIASTSNEAVRRLTHFNGVNVRYPAWHPDGDRILFTAEGEKGEQLFLVDVVGGDVTALDLPYEQVTTPDWLPSGSGMVFGCVKDDQRGICLANDQETQLIVSGYFKPQAISDTLIMAVSDDGGLYEISLVDGEQRLVWDGLPGKGRNGWVVDGNELVFVSAGEAGLGRLIRRKLDTGVNELLFEGPIPLADTSISIGSATGAILFTQYHASSDDLVVYEGFNPR